MRHRSGLTVLELLITLAILGVLVGIGYVAMRPNHALITAQEVQAMMRNARFEAVRLTRPVEVAWEKQDGVWTIQAFVLEPQTAGHFDINKQPECGKDRIPDREVFNLFDGKSTFSAAKSVNKIDSDKGTIYWLPNGMAWLCNTHEQVNGSLELKISAGNQFASVKFVGSYDVEVKRP